MIPALFVSWNGMKSRDRFIWWMNKVQMSTTTFIAPPFGMYMMYSCFGYYFLSYVGTTFKRKKIIAVLAIGRMEQLSGKRLITMILFHLVISMSSKMC